MYLTYCVRMTTLGFHKPPAPAPLLYTDCEALSLSVVLILVLLTYIRLTCGYVRALHAMTLCDGLTP